MVNSTEMPPLKGKFVQANGLEIYYREWGAGKPLILLHPGTVTHEKWFPYIPAFSEKYRVIAPDNRGHGRTINPEPVLTYQMMADDLAGLILALGLDKPLVFGYSDGGQAALDMGIRYPDLVGALALGGVWFQFSQYYQDSITRGGFVSPGEMDFEVYERQAQQDWEARLSKVHHDPRPDYPRILLSALAKLWWTPLNYSDEDLGKITAPVLILVGENDEHVAVEEVQELAGKIPKAELAVIPGASHRDVFSNIQPTLDLVLDFLECQPS